MASKEEILEVACPKCGAQPLAYCDRAGEKLGGSRTAKERNRQLMAEGRPPSHQERQVLRQDQFAGARRYPKRDASSWTSASPPSVAWAVANLDWS